MKVILNPPKEVIDFIYNRGIVCEERCGRYMKLPEWILIKNNGTISEVPYKELPDSVKHIEISYRHPEKMFTLQELKSAYEEGQSDCGEFGRVMGFDSYVKDKYGIEKKEV